MSKEEISADLPGSEPVAIKVEDRRFWARPALDSGSGAEAGAPRLPTFVEQLQQQLEAARQRLDQTRDAVRQIQSEADQSRQRLLRDVEARAERKVALLLAPVLEAIDGLDLALRSARDKADLEGLIAGLELVRAQLGSRLLELGLERLAAAGAEFDPTLHEAVAAVATGDPEQAGRVIQELQAGYRLGETLIRPARVTVGKAQDE
jgi:molecular chaperone GrpE